MLTSYAVSPVLFNLVCDTSRLDHRNMSNYLLVCAQVDNKKQCLKTELNMYSAVHTRTIACAAPWLEPARQHSLGTFPVTWGSPRIGCRRLSTTRTWMTGHFGWCVARAYIYLSLFTRNQLSAALPVCTSASPRSSAWQPQRRRVTTLQQRLQRDGIIAACQWS